MFLVVNIAFQQVEPTTFPFLADFRDCEHHHRNRRRRNNNNNNYNNKNKNNNNNNNNNDNDIYLSIYEIYIAPLQGNYSEALPAQARAKIKVLRSL